MTRESSASSPTSFEMYRAEISRFPVLTAEEEVALARKYREKGDGQAAHQLVTANLRFVVRVANEYRAYGFRVTDLIQEGNIGLMRAVQKFDPERGIRLISYAVWWIRAYIQNFILKSWSLVKLGTTQAQRKLFFSLARARRELDRLNDQHGRSAADDTAKLARKLRVKPAEVEEMTQRMGSRDFALDAPVGEDGASSHIDFLADDAEAHDEELAAAQDRRVLQGRVGAALGRLSERERFIVEQRILSDEPMTLNQLGDHFGVSRERARQLEIRAKEKLRKDLQATAQPGEPGSPFERAWA